ncbi:MAG: thioredoxin-disulfide reductase [Candidatus Bathyarchaeota archaeon]|nr:thioredoxin-disulfide reductase [Candidatus Bathyarchaeota archaeon]
MEDWELIIIGAGPAGLAAGLYAGRSGLKTLVLEAKMAGGEAAITPWIENYPGFERISGPELVEKMTAHCKKFGAQLIELESVLSLETRKEKRLVVTDKATYSVSAAIVTTGTHYRHLNVPGEEEFQGKGVSYCALCDGAFFKSKKVLVVGGGNSAATSANYLASLASDVLIVHRRGELRAEAAYVKSLEQVQNVKFALNSEIRAIKGLGVVKSVTLRESKTGRTTEVEVDGVFVQIGEVPNTEFLKGSGVRLDDQGYVVVDERQRTSISGIFAAGDVTNKPVKQVGTAVGQGIMAATEAFGFVKRPYYYAE